MIGEAPVQAVRTQVWTVPTDAPEADGTLSWDATTVVAVEVDAGGTTGLGWSYTDPAAATVVDHTLGDVVVGRDAMDPPAIYHALERAVRNIGRSGVVAAAISALDVAVWDLKARLLDVPLVWLLGRARAVAPAYGSGGFTTWDDDRLTRAVDDWLAAGLPAVKLKIGEADGMRLTRDLRRVDVALAATGGSAEVYVDANGGYTRAQALRVGRELDARGVTWFEEPVTSDDLCGLAELRGALGCDVTAGEYVWSAWDAQRLLAARAVDCLQLDVTRCGGVSGWQRAAAAADAAGVEVSAHCAPQLSAQLVATTPRARHLEWFHDHEHVDAALFDGLLPLVNGTLRPDLTRPGHGVALKPVPSAPARRVA